MQMNIHNIRYAAAILFIFFLHSFEVYAYERKEIGSWEVTSFDDNVYLATTTNLGNEVSMLSYGCSKLNNGCNFIIKANLECQNGIRMPIFINTDSGAFSILGDCVHLKDRIEIIIDKQYTSNIRAAINDSNVAGVSIPLLSGEFKIIKFYTYRSDDALSEAETKSGLNN